MSKMLVFGILVLALLLAGCAQKQQMPDSESGAKEQQAIDRESKIPADAVKITQEADVSPPQTYSDEYEKPVPVPGLVNSAGAEDSAFVMPDGNTLYFFFTPDVRVPVEKQIIDGITGIYVSKKTGNDWGKPERIFLQDPGKLAMDGCEFVQNNIMLFCSVREGYTGVNWFTAEYKENKWQSWKNADFNPDYKVGELHIADDELYFHSDRPGGKGGLDIWVSKKANGEWSEPENVEAVNTADSEGWPAISPDGNELWISRNYGLWRSKKVNSEWQTPKLIISPLAGEASIDSEGNVYFTHHFYKNDKMLEADIYVAYKK